MHSVGGWTVEAVEEHDTAKTALAICHRDENKTEGEEDARTEETAMIKAAARCKFLKNPLVKCSSFNFRLGYYVEQRSSKEIKLRKELPSGDKVSKFEILEMIPFSPEDDMTGMYVQETDGDEAVNRLFLKGTKEAFEKMGKEITVTDFTARGLNTIFFASATLSNKEWSELEYFVGDNNYRRDKNSEKVKKS